MASDRTIWRAEEERDTVLTMKSTICLCALSGAIVSSVGACSNNEVKPAPSDSVAALSEMINLQLPLKSAHWEVFGTPEYTGGVPGPTDFVTLIAELEPGDDWLNDSQPPTGNTYVAPEAARPWLSDHFRTLLEKNRNSSSDLSAQSNCRKYSTTIKKSGRPVDGFVCNNAGHLLLYLTLSSAS